MGGAPVHTQAAPSYSALGSAGRPRERRVRAPLGPHLPLLLLRQQVQQEQPLLAIGLGVPPRAVHRPAQARVLRTGRRRRGPPARTVRGSGLPGGGRRWHRGRNVPGCCNIPRAAPWLRRGRRLGWGAERRGRGHDRLREARAQARPGRRGLPQRPVVDAHPEARLRPSSLRETPASQHPLPSALNSSKARSLGPSRAHLGTCACPVTAFATQQDSGLRCVCGCPGPRCCA